MRLHTIALLLATMPNAAPAQTTTPVSLVDVTAIAAALGVDTRQLHGLVTVRIFDGGDGGRLDLPPRAVGDALCRFDRHTFEGNATTGYKRFGGPFLLYWLRARANCEPRTADDIPAEIMGAHASIPPNEVRAVLERSQDLIDSTRDFPHCEPEMRFWATFVPRYISSLSYRKDGEGYEATIAEGPDVNRSMWVSFSLTGSELTAHRVCYEHSDLVGYQNPIWEFVVP